MKSEMDCVDVVIIGGGPAGLMAAISAARAGASVRLLEKGDRLGRKLLLSGGGRCNVTNIQGNDHIIKNIPGNGRFMYSVLSQWSSEDIILFFENLGVSLKEEDRGRMFPVTNKASTVLNALIAELSVLGVMVSQHAAVDHILYSAEHSVVGVHLKSGDCVNARAVVVASGGCTVPQTGSTGDGYELAREVGHHVVDVYPTSVPLLSDEPWIKDRTLQGLSFGGITLTLYDPTGRIVIIEEGDMIFTHFGLSGPSVLRVSQYVVKSMKKFRIDHLQLTIDLLPHKTSVDLRSEVVQVIHQHPRRSAAHLLRDFIPERMANLIVQICSVPTDLEATHITKDQIDRLLQIMKRFPVRITGTLGIEKATVTGGGISTKEIHPASMASRVLSGLFFAGEVIDVHAHTGGYNITTAFATGYVAGRSAANMVNERRDTDGMDIHS